jgi:nitrosocyanin
MKIDIGDSSMIDESDDNPIRRQAMRVRGVVYGFIVAILLAGVASPISAQSVKEFTALTATVAEGANIWLPSAIVVKNGDQVKLTLRNVSKAEHGFSIDELGIKEVIPPGETKEVTLKPAAAGALRYYCQLHKGHVGGQLLVQ